MTSIIYLNLPHFVGFAEAIVEIETTPDIAVLPPADVQEPEYLENIDPPALEVKEDNVPNYTPEDSTATDDEAPLTIDEGSR